MATKRHNHPKPFYPPLSPMQFLLACNISRSRVSDSLKDRHPEQAKLALAQSMDL
jgi:hypothetical protein